MDYLDCLNTAQTEGVINTQGPSMIIAGAGSGKTRVLTYRIAHLIKAKQVDPFNILSLTFTNKAAKEMRQRIELVVGTDARNLWMGTFHSVFARMLRAEAGKLGYPSNFTIYDTEDSKSLLKSIIKELHLDDKIYRPNVVYNRISGAKNRLISWKEYSNHPVLRGEDESSLKPQLSSIYQTYVDRCFKASAMDFDDLLFNTDLLFKKHTDVLNKYQHRFQYVLVDEFQDTNISQYTITKKLASVHENICVVGDDAQSIYAFRGASIQNILNFEKDFPELTIYRLEQNYRSTQNIVNAANSVICNNQAQIKKTVWTSNPTGELIDMIKAETDNEEGKLVATTIFEQKMNKQLANKDFAILYRTNSQSRAMEEALRKFNIRYKIYGGLSFYQRREIKDILAYLRFVINTQDEQALKRIINLPKRGIGPGSVQKIIVAAYDHDISIWKVIQNIGQFLPGRISQAVANFAIMIKSFRIEAERRDAFETASFIAKGSGLLKGLYEDKTIEGLNRYENLQELLNAIKEFVDNPENDETSLGAFLQEVALISDLDNQPDDKKNKDDNDTVTLMTIHSAKGLEFKHVFLVGMEEDLFPSQMMLSSRADLEEERRLFYVALTRAQEKITLCHAATRYRFGRLKTCEPSRFMEEIDPKYINVVRRSRKTIQPVQNVIYSKRLFSNLQSTNNKNFSRINHIPSPDFEPSDTSNLSEGMKVEHPKFGFGKVVEMDFEGSIRKAKVNFNNFGEKTLLLSFAKLKIHE